MPGKCGICGKTLTRADSIAAGIGPVCAAKQAVRAGHLAAGLSPDFSTHFEDEPNLDDFVKLRVVANHCKNIGIPVYRLVKAFGGDGTVEPPVSEEFQVYWFRNVRYLKGEVLDVLEMLRDKDF